MQIRDYDSLLLPTAKLYTNMWKFDHGRRAHFVDKQGRELSWTGEYEDARGFVNGYAPVQQNGLWGLIGTNGTFAIEPRFIDCGTYSEGLLCVADRSNEYFYVDKGGKDVFGKRFQCARDFSEGLAPVCVDGSWGFIDHSGAIVLNGKFDNAFPFSEGLASVVADHKFGAINRRGETVIEPQFDELGNFRESLAPFGKLSTDPARHSKLGSRMLYGFVDQRGRVVIEPKFYAANPFSEHRACVQDLNWSYVYIDKKGNPVLGPYEVASDFSAGFAAVFHNDHPCFINSRGDFVLDGKNFFAVRPFSSGSAIVFR